MSVYRYVYVDGPYTLVCIADDISIIHPIQLAELRLVPVLSARWHCHNLFFCDRRRMYARRRGQHSTVTQSTLLVY